MAKRTGAVPPPPVGAAYAVPLSNGLWGGCRVIRIGDPAGIGGKRAVLVGALAYIGRTPPTGNEPNVAELLSLDHHAHHGPSVIWVPGYRGPVPTSFVPIAAIPPTAEDLARPARGYAGWDYIVTQIECQWRWNHDRDAVLQEDVARRERTAAHERDAAAERMQTLDALTLSDVRAERRFTTWRGFCPTPAIAASRRLFTDMIDELIALGPKPAFAAARPIFQACVERFNTLDEKHGHFVETMTREEIADAFARVVHVAGFVEYENTDLTEEWRDW